MINKGEKIDISGEELDISGEDESSDFLLRDLSDELKFHGIFMKFPIVSKNIWIEWPKENLKNWFNVFYIRVRLNEISIGELITEVKFRLRKHRNTIN